MSAEGFKRRKLSLLSDDGDVFGSRTTSYCYSQHYVYQDEFSISYFYDISAVHYSERMTFLGVDFWLNICIFNAVIAIVLHAMLIRLYIVEKSHRNCFTTICVSRSIVHVVSSLAFLIIHALGARMSSHMFHDLFYFVHFITTYYAGSELLLSINRCIAILKWDVYNHIFSPANCLFFVCFPFAVAICLKVSHFIAYHSFLMWYEEITGILLLYEPICTLLSHLVNLITFIAIIVYKLKSDSTRTHSYNIFQKNVKTFIFSFLQLLFTSTIYLTSWQIIFLDKSDLVISESLRGCLILLVLKDFLEGVSLTILYRKLVFNFRKQNNRVYVLTM